MRKRSLPPPPPNSQGAEDEFARGTDPLKAWDTSGTLDRQDWDALVPFIEQAGVEPAVILDRLRQYSSMLISWNRSFSNLISKNDEDRLVSRHLMESVALAPWLKEAGIADWVDLGSGGGLPAIPLQFLGVGARWTLVESRRTKTLFLRRVAQEMALGSLEVVNDRIETLVEGGAHAGTFGGFTSRATLTLAPTLQFAAALVATGGSAFLWKGSGCDAEMAAEPEWRSSWRFDEKRRIGDGQVVVARFVRL